ALMSCPAEPPRALQHGFRGGRVAMEKRDSGPHFRGAKVALPCPLANDGRVRMKISDQRHRARPPAISRQAFLRAALLFAASPLLRYAPAEAGGAEISGAPPRVFAHQS